MWVRNGVLCPRNAVVPVYSIRYNEFNGGCTNMIKIAICDDEMTFVDKINTLISEWSDKTSIFP